MSIEYTVTSQEFYIHPRNYEEMREAALKVMGDYADSTSFYFQHPTEELTHCSIYFSGEAGYSFPERIAELAKTIGPFLLAPVSLKLREETSDDERDMAIYAGPTTKSAELAELRDKLASVQRSLDGVTSMSASKGLSQSISDAVKNVTFALEEVNANLREELASVAHQAPDDTANATPAPTP